MEIRPNHRIKKANLYRSARPRKPFSEVTKLRKECAQLKRANSVLTAVNSEQTNRISHLEAMVVAAMLRQNTSMCRQPPGDPAPSKRMMAGMKVGDNSGVPASGSPSSLWAKKHARENTREQDGSHQRAKSRCMAKRLELDNHNSKQCESATANGMDCELIYHGRNQVLRCNCALSIRAKHVSVTCRREACHPCKHRQCCHTSTLTHFKTLIPYLAIFVAVFFKGG